MIRILLITLCLFSVDTQANDNERLNLLLCAVASKFSIDIKGPFDQYYETYHFCYDKDKRAVLVKFYGTPSKDNEDYTYNFLTEDQVTALLKAHSIALDLNLKDDTHGLDGFVWTFKSKVYQELTLKIWSPSIKSEARGYQGLLSLRDIMQSFAEKTHNKSIQ